MIRLCFIHKPDGLWSLSVNEGGRHCLTGYWGIQIWYWCFIQPLLLWNSANELISSWSTNPADGIVKCCVDPSSVSWMRVVGAAKSQLAEAAAHWREACWWDHSNSSRMIHSLTFGMLTPQREGREWGASRSQRAALAWKRALLVDGEITAEARAESPTKSGIRGELQRREKASKLRWIEMHLIANVAWKQAKLVDITSIIITYTYISELHVREQLVPVIILIVYLKQVTN